MDIRVVFVDLGGVLIISNINEIGKKYSNLYGLTLEVSKEIFRFIQTDKRPLKEINQFLKLKNVKPNVWENFTKELYSSETRNEDLVRLLTKAKNKGIKIIFTTNNSNSLLKIIHKYQLENLADFIVNSSKLHAAKPDKEFWKAAFDEARKLITNLNHKEVLVIDDSSSNCLSAKELGFQTCKYVNKPSSEDDVSSILMT